MAEDQKLRCAWNGCSDEFTWTKGEQEFYAARKFSAPRFCKTHRAEMKKAREKKQHRSESVFAPENIPGHDRYRGTNDKEALGL